MMQKEFRVTGVFGDVENAKQFLHQMSKRVWIHAEPRPKGHGLSRHGRLVCLTTNNHNCKDIFHQFLVSARATIRTQ